MHAAILKGNLSLTAQLDPCTELCVVCFLCGVAGVLPEVLGSMSSWASVVVGPPVENAELQLTAILNPLTREAQRLSQVRRTQHLLASRPAP